MSNIVWQTIRNLGLAEQGEGFCASAGWPMVEQRTVVSWVSITVRVDDTNSILLKIEQV